MPEELCSSRAQVLARAKEWKDNRVQPARCLNESYSAASSSRAHETAKKGPVRDSLE